METDIVIENIAETTSTNDYLDCRCREKQLEEFHTIAAECQTAGKGQRGNTWESEPGKNLTFSTVLYPTKLRVEKHFMLSVLAATSVLRALSRYAQGFSIKWPNDIYWNNRKIGGILIENELEGKKVCRSIIGIGLNLNQRHFCSDAPNPVSLYQIIGKEIERQEMLQNILHELAAGYPAVNSEDENRTNALFGFYLEHLYRNRGRHVYRDAQGEFRAELQGILPDGRLCLKDEQGNIRTYAFKEVAFVLPHE